MKAQFSDSDSNSTMLASDGLPMWASVEEILKENMKTYSQDEVEALVAKAVADATAELSAKLAGIEAEMSSAEKAEVAAQIEALDETIKELQKKLDTAVLEAANAAQENADLIAFLEATKAEEERQEEIAALREGRLAKVAEVASFPEDYLESNADRWAAMTEDEFAATVADYALVAKKDDSGEQIPSKTALVASKEVVNEGSAVGSIFAMRFSGVDARTIL